MRTQLLYINHQYYCSKITVAINYNLILMTPIAVSERQNVCAVPLSVLTFCNKQLYN